MRTPPNTLWARQPQPPTIPKLCPLHLLLTVIDFLPTPGQPAQIWASEGVRLTLQNTQSAHYKPDRKRTDQF